MRSVVVALLAAVVFGCSSSDEGGKTSVTADQACTELAAAICDKAQTCASAFVTLSWGDVATCEQRQKIECMQNLAAPGTASTPSDFSACAKEAKAAQCSALLDNQTPTACLPKAGGVEDGRACSTDSQCKSGFCDFNNDKVHCGVCAPKPAAGGPCENGKCPAGLVCANKKCNAPVAVGGACSADTRCVSGSTCFGGKCVADATTEGAACDEMAGPNCDGRVGLFCVAKKCTKPALVAAGTKCGFEYDVATMTVKSVTLCAKAGYCKGLDLEASPPVLEGTCEAPAADGAACIEDATFNKGPGCIEPAECIGGKCVLPDATACK